MVELSTSWVDVCQAVGRSSGGEVDDKLIIRRDVDDNRLIVKMHIKRHPKSGRVSTHVVMKELF